MVELRAVLVSVDYGDLLALTLPRNARHFQEILVVTTPGDRRTIEVVQSVPHARFLATNEFYDDGAIFNKGRALETGLSQLGRCGWLCVLDADIVWPADLNGFHPVKNKLGTPVRRLVADPFQWDPQQPWENYPLHREAQYAGYTQIFHADDPHLGPLPWYPTDWTHAGGCDSAFQRKWPARSKYRPPFTVLHLGPIGKNWAGRTTPYADGTTHPDAEARRRQLAEIHSRRRPGRQRYAHEKIRR